MSKRIERNEIAEEGVLNNLLEPLKVLIGSLDEADKKLQSFADTVKNSVKSADDAKGMRELEQSTQAVNKAFTDKLEIDKQREKLAKDIEKAEAKLVLMQDEEYKQLQQLRKAQREQNQSLKDGDDAYKKLSKSVRDAKNESKTLGAELLALEKSGLKNTEAYAKLAQTYEDVTKRAQEGDSELKKLDKTVGDNFRNVGNYSDGIKNAVQEMGFFSREIAILNKGKKIMTAVFSKSKTSVDDTSKSITKAGFSVKSLGSMFKLLRVAIISTGIGALVIALGSLITFLTTTQEGINAVRKVTVPLGVVFDRFKGILQETGKAIFDSFKNPKQAIIDFGKLIWSQIWNRITAIGKAFKGLYKIITGEFKEGLAEIHEASVQFAFGVEDATNKLKKFGQEMTAEAKKAWALGDAIRQLEDDLRLLKIANTVELAELSVAYEKTLELARDQTATTKERLKAFEEAEKLLRTQEELKAKELRTELEIMKLRTQTSDTSDEDKLKIAEKQAELLLLEASTQSKLNGLLKTKSGLLKQEAEASFQRELSIKKLSELEQQLNIDRENRRLKELRAEGVHSSELMEQRRKIAQMEQALLVTKYENEIIQAKGNKIELQALEMRHLRALEVLMEQYNDDIEAISKSQIQIEKQTNEEIFNEKAKDLERTSRQQKLINLRTIKDDEAFKAEELKREQELIKKKIELRKKLNLDTVELEIQLLELSKQNLETQKDNTKEIFNELKDVAFSTYDAIANQAMQSYKNQEQSAQQMYSALAQMASTGNITAQESLAEQVKAQEEAQKAQMKIEQKKQKMQLISQGLNTFGSFIDAGDNPQVALGKTGVSMASLIGLINSLPSFFVGTEDTGKNGKGVDGKGGFVSILHPNERVMTAEQNAMTKGLSNPMLADVAWQYKTGNLVPKSYDGSFAVVSELVALRRVVEQQPKMITGLEQTLTGMVKLVVSEQRGSHKNTNIYKS
jgi:hypothetical protein